MMSCSKMLSVVAMLVLTTSVIVEAQPPPTADCATKLLTCSQSLNSTKPAKQCCDSLGDAIKNDLACLCKLYSSGVLANFGINVTEALLLPKRCELPGDLSGCNNINGTANTNTSSSVPPPPPPGVIEIGAEGVTMKINEPSIIDLEKGWGIMQKGMTKLTNILKGLPEQQFSSEEYMTLYTAIYDMCTQKPPHDYSQQLYEKYRESFEEYISSTVLPPLREKHDEFMLREFVQRWLNHKIMIRWLSRFFHYLDRYFIPTRSLPTLNEVGLTCFRDLVYHELNGKLRDAVISLIGKEREGEQINRDLLKNVLDIFVELGMGQMDYYENDFEATMLKNTATYYSRMASNWILEDSCPDYMLKVEECLGREKERVGHYLHSSTEAKLLEKVQHELLYVYATHILENEHSGWHALLGDDKVGDLSRIYTKGVVGSSSAELVATVCDIPLKKGGSGKLSEEAIKEKLEKVGMVQEESHGHGYSA